MIEGDGGAEVRGSFFGTTTLRCFRLTGSTSYFQKSGPNDVVLADGEKPVTFSWVQYIVQVPVH